MIRKSSGDRRKGTILPLAAVSLVSVCGFVALAFDIGLIAVAKTQCQNSADAGSMAGARSLDGSSGQNLGSSTPPYSAGTAYYYAYTYAENNLIINSPPTSVQIQFGAWHYDTTNKLFTPNFPPVSPDNYNLCQVTVNYNVQTVFAQAFGLLDPTFNSVQQVTAVAQAAHRPRDVAIILDFSGSMNNESDLWNCEGYLASGSGTNNTSGYTWPKTDNAEYTSNNVEPVYPLFGHYAGSTGTAQSNNGNDYSHYDTCPNLLCPAAVSGTPLYNNTEIGKSNIATDLTASNTGIPSAYQAFSIPAVVKDFFSNNRGATANSAFTSAGDGDSTGYVAGDVPLRVGGSTSSGKYAATVADIINQTGYSATKWETLGYDKYYDAPTTFQGYTTGPRYWGKTFFIWPPDPRSGAGTSSTWLLGCRDWRKLYFKKSDGTAFAATDKFDNTKLFVNGSGGGIGYNDPSGNYQINYKAILDFIQNRGTTVFPSQLRSGNVLFYDSIPTDVPASAYDHTQANSAITDPNQRFWKEYIDYVLGVWRAPTNSIQHTQQPSCSIGPDFQYLPGGSNGGGSVQISGPPGDSRYMDYKDNPWRPRHRYWFGPMTMVQFMSDCGYLSGATHDISMYPMKQGVGGALLDIQNNHPNDLVAMLLFARPQFNDDSLGTGAFNGPQYNLNNNYSAMVKALWIPPNSGTSDIRLWTTDGNNIPRAHGDYDANTTSDYGFMLAYNQFSGDSTDLVDSNGKAVGGLGRKGATRLVIYETDGMANQAANPTGGFTNNGAYNSYYPIRPGTDTVDQAGYSDNGLLQVVMAICNKDDGTPYYSYPSGYPTPPSYPGYATANKPVIVQCIAFGAIFEVPSGTQNSAVNLLQEISTIGGTTFPSSSTDTANGFKWCIGTLQQRQQKLQTAFLNFLDTSVPVSLIQ